jgi:tRNA-specific 2-thiouridylase
MEKIIVGMSGGVDSSVALYLLRKHGYEVEGVSFMLYEARLRRVFAKSSCCSVEVMNDARKTAESLGVRHTVVDLRGVFMEKVIEPFINAYAKGITPNPCILCNKHIKFPYLSKIANEKGFKFIATGHYARVMHRLESRVQSPELRDKDLLLKGIDEKKDQSYVLYVLKRKELERLVLPLGEKRKDEVREIAQSLKLPAAKRPESQEICFIEDKNYFKLLDNISEPAEGPIINIETGKVIGSHKGVHLYTIGQRKRIPAMGKPVYVVKIDISKNAVYIGPREAAMMKSFEVEEVNWLIGRSRLSVHASPITHNSFRASVKVRSTMKDEPATVSIINENKITVVFDEPQWAPAPGQSAVFYDGDIVIGGGVIAKQ